MRRDTLEELYRAHYRPALLYTLSLCGDPAQAEDIVSAAFETALLTLEEGSPGFRYWLLKVSGTGGWTRSAGEGGGTRRRRRTCR